MQRAGKITVAGPGYATMSKAGTSIVIKRSAPTQPTAETAAPAPWYPFITKDNSGNAQANFYPGTLGGVLPSNMFSALTLTQGQVNYVYAQVTASAGAVTAVTLAASTTYPTLPAINSGSPGTSFNIPIGIFDLTQSPAVCYNTVGYGNIWAQPYVASLATKATGALLTAPFTVSYGWEWGAGD